MGPASRSEDGKERASDNQAGKAAQRRCPFGLATTAVLLPPIFIFDIVCVRYFSKFCFDKFAFLIEIRELVDLRHVATFNSLLGYVTLIIVEYTVYVVEREVKLGLCFVADLLVEPVLGRGWG
uniref:Uncharacterized protein n=1 Tax=Odontella aurita TaxID=265563 RepID=A0A7S4K0A1_9STRA